MATAFHGYQRFFVSLDHRAWYHDDSVDTHSETEVTQALLQHRGEDTPRAVKLRSSRHSETEATQALLEHTG